jgi:hypothetical protein
MYYTEVLCFVMLCFARLSHFLMQGLNVVSSLQYELLLLYKVMLVTHILLLSATPVSEIVCLCCGLELKCLCLSVVMRMFVRNGDEGKTSRRK